MLQGGATKEEEEEMDPSELITFIVHLLNL
jgi:hypothetical protein